MPQRKILYVRTLTMYFEKERFFVSLHAFNSFMSHLRHCLRRNVCNVFWHSRSSFVSLYVSSFFVSQARYSGYSNILVRCKAGIYQMLATFIWQNGDTFGMNGCSMLMTQKIFFVSTNPNSFSGVH